MVENISLFKSGRTGYYYIQWSENGIRHQKSTRSKQKSDAVRILRDFTPTERNRIPVEISWEDFRKEYEQFSEGFHSVSSTKTIIDGFNSLERYLGNNKMLRAITVKDADQYISYLKSKCSVHTARKHYITLAAAF